MTPFHPSAAGPATGSAGTTRARVAHWLLERLGWSKFYRITSYLRSALWGVPILAVVLERLTYRLLHFIDQWVYWDLTGLDADGARALFQTLITLTLSFIVFTFGSLLVALQVASAQLTPRIIATTLLRDKVIKYSVGLNVFTLMFAVHGLNRTGATVMELATFVAALLGITCLASFLFFIDHAARLLRPVNIVALVSDQGMDVIRSVYPRDAEAGPARAAEQSGFLAQPHRIVSQAGRSQIVLAVELDALVAHAARVDGVIEFVPQVGDFVATDEPLFRLYGGARTLDDAAVCGCVAFGPERTMEQDPMFSFRILVDIALKALSPAINDPTTAVLAMDQIHRLLRVVGKRRLHDEFVHDPAGRVRLVLRTPNWDDFVHIAFTEIRACGANNVQIARRMRAMLENLVRTLPGTRQTALLQQLDLLDRTLAETYRFPEDLALARVPDPQGLGGAAPARNDG
ncbi:MAG: DUF2254 domain-containing protein [Steroidobacteraceae bacterium]